MTLIKDIIITPNTAIFKEGEVYVYTLQEEPNQEDYDIGNNRPMEEERYNENHIKWRETVSYARAHPFKVAEKDKEKVRYRIFLNERLTNEYLDQYEDWKPTDITEYMIEVKMRIEEVMSPRIKINDQTEGAVLQQVACLIEDDGVKEERPLSEVIKSSKLFKKKQSPSEEGKEEKISSIAIFTAETYLGLIPNDPNHQKNIEYLAYLFDDFYRQKLNFESPNEGTLEEWRELAQVFQEQNFQLIQLGQKDSQRIAELESKLKDLEKKATKRL